MQIRRLALPLIPVAVFLSLLALTTFTQAGDEPSSQSNIEAPRLSLSAYYSVLGDCHPTWDAEDTGVIAIDGQQLGHQPDDVQLAFLEAWKDLAWQRWRWEYNCLLDYFMTPTPTATVEVGQTETPTVNPMSYEGWQRVHDAAIARGASEDLARQIANFVVVKDSVERGATEDFLNGISLDVVYGEHHCAQRSAACPLSP